ncbi:hypothetical protein BO71DRAFT_397837 [Aspergillus ellipticus CBS 707.79]|uniref:Uncharacterized protein n=1 Tax=Aspergillus ellipticus CBS 707.79 TaxID=1448320 RepID=A0A319DNH8_9EURO|nr:hypothetical protein BO71DRAFT_397837 [Aspergillus ellipticus CBS 707.79]
MANTGFGTDHHRVEFPTTVIGLPTAFPPVMGRLGVPPSMWEQDMQYIRSMSEKLIKDQKRELWLLLLTCGFSICFHGPALDRYNSNLHSYVHAMNGRYAPYGIIWETYWIRYSGTYMSYET